PDKLSFTIEKTDPKALDGKATIKEISIKIGEKSGEQPVATWKMLLIVPNERKGPAPVFVGLNFSGNAEGTKDFKTWAVDSIIERGYALAVMHRDNVSPDNAKATDHLFLRYPKKIDERGPTDWSTIGCWAWSLSRAVDYLVTDKDIDAKRIAS